MKQWKQKIIAVRAEAYDTLERCTLGAIIIAGTAYAVIKALGL